MITRIIPIVKKVVNCLMKITTRQFSLLTSCLNFLKLFCSVGVERAPIHKTINFYLRMETQPIRVYSHQEAKYHDVFIHKDGIDRDIKRRMKKFNIKNMLLRQFGYCLYDVKCHQLKLSEVMLSFLV